MKKINLIVDKVLSFIKYLKSQGSTTSNDNEYVNAKLAKEKLEKFHEMVKLAHPFVPDYLFKWPQMAWWNNSQFSNYLKLIGENDPTNSFNSDRRWMAYQLLRLIQDIEGDTAECGVWKGATSWLILANNLNYTNGKLHYCIDSFEGLSAPIDADGSHWTEGDLNCPLNEVEQFLRLLDPANKSVRYCKGWIPDSFKFIHSQSFSFVHIDVDLYFPTKEALKFFYPKMTSGGIILCDDYGFTSCPGATKAVDEFFSDKREKMIPLSGGGGFLIKGKYTTDSANLFVPNIQL
jgi:O-methyltransferase